MAEYLLDKLREYSRSDYYPLHMPGHKRNPVFFENPYAIDITEIDGFDNLSHAEGILLEAQRRAAGLYGAEETFYLVNGSTCGILAAVSACVRRGDRILMARNSHKAAYHAAFLNGLRVTYLYPETDINLGMNGAVKPETVRSALYGGALGAGDGVYAPDLNGEVRAADGAFSDSRGMSAANRAFCDGGEMSAADGAFSGGVRMSAADGTFSGGVRMSAADGAFSGGGGMSAADGRVRVVLITSPTYDGVVSDIRAIARDVHQAGAILIVDEAHGAHFAMHPYFPESALACGADIVINSLHKTMPSLTQTALLHVQGPRVNRDRLRRYLGIYQSSSPNYVLMAGMDACVRKMQEQGKALFDTFTARLEKLRGELGDLRSLYLVTGREPGLQAFDFDRSRILISTARCRLTGPKMGALLRGKYHLEPEMEAEQYVTAILTVADTEEGLARLRDALLEIDRMLRNCYPAEDPVLQQKEQGKSAEQAWRTGEPGKSAEQMGRTGEPGRSAEQAACTGEPGRSAEQAACTGESGKFAEQAACTCGVFELPHPAAVLSMEEAEYLPHCTMPLSSAGGYISAEFAYLYPPGIPFLVPGERIPAGLPALLEKYRDMGLNLQGLRDVTGQTIETVTECE